MNALLSSNARQREREGTCSKNAYACGCIGDQIGLLHIDKRLRLLMRERDILIALCVAYDHTAGQYRDVAKSFIDKLGRMKY
jgi:hypothetical protein